MSAGLECFADNIGHLSFCDFLSDCWEVAPRHLASAVEAPERIFDTLAFQACLVAQAQAGSSLPCIVQGHQARPLSSDREKRDPVGAAAAAISQSASVLLTGLQATAPALARLCRQLDNLFLAHGVLLEKPVFANAYLTPPSSQGFGIHYDDHCVLVLQLAGTKHWVVGAADKPLPVSRCMQLLPDECLQAPLLDIELRAGDLLYIPRGFPHVARCTEQMSLHVTFGISAVTWSALIRRMADDVALLRSSVRPFPSGRTSAAGFFSEEALPAMMRDDPAGRIEVMLGECLDALPPLAPETSGRFPGIALSDTTLLTRRGHVLTMPALRGDRAVLHFPGGPIELPAAAFEALAFVADNDSFQIGEIPGFEAPFSRIELAGMFVRRGIVSVAGDRQPTPPHRARVAVHAD